jgi:4-amino-4-deoxy-L-arabinose transferase-like glycosyltransferase
MRRRASLILLPCLLLLCVTLPHPGQGDFRRDSGRYAAISHYLWTGGDLFTPSLGPDTPYLNKPPLAFWIHGWFLKVFGRNLVAARLPSIAAALGVLVLSILSAHKLGSRSEAVVSGMVLALTYEFFRRTREISLDFWQLLCLMLAVYLFASGLRDNSRVKILLSGVGIGLGLLCKPFVSLGVIPVLAVWAVMSRRGRLLPALFLGAVPLALLIAFPWHYHMYLKHGHAFIQQYIFHEVVGRAQGENGRAPFYYYAIQLASTYWPWLIGLAWALYVRFQPGKPARAPARDLIALGSVWVIWVLLGISLFADKSPNYALPLYPILSWMVAAGLCRLPWRALSKWYRTGFKWLAPAASVLLVVLSVAPIRFQEGPSRDWQALFAWMKTNSTAPETFAAADMKQNERCYFYIRTGWWLPQFNASTRAEWILAPRGTNEVNAQMPFAFTAKNFKVVAVTNWVEALKR